MLTFLRTLLIPKEVKKDLQELQRWRSTWSEYHRWLSVIPVMTMMLDNLNTEVRGRGFLDACHPPSRTGPWTIGNLRHHILKILKGETVASKNEEVWHCTTDVGSEEIKRLRQRVKELELQVKDASDIVIAKNRELNIVRSVCGETYQLVSSQQYIGMEAMENLYAVAEGGLPPHGSPKSKSKS